MSGELDSDGQMAISPIPLQVFRVSSTSKKKKVRCTEMRPSVLYKTRRGYPHMLPSLDSDHNNFRLADDAVMPVTPQSALLKRIESSTFVTDPFDVSGLRRSYLRLPMILPLPTFENRRNIESDFHHHFVDDQMDVADGHDHSNVSGKNLEVQSLPENLRRERSVYTLYDSVKQQSVRSSPPTKTRQHSQPPQQQYTSSVPYSTHSVICRATPLPGNAQSSKSIASTHIVGDLGAFTTNILR